MDIGAVPIGLKRPDNHRRAQVGTAGADMNDGLERFSGGAGHFAVPDVAANPFHGLPGGDDFLIAAGAARVAERHMQRWAPLGGIDFLAGGHAPAPAFDVGLAGQINQQRISFGAHPVLGII